MSFGHLAGILFSTSPELLRILVGFFAIDEKPTGSKDPFALRRAALGVLRILVEKSLDLDLAAAIEHALQNLRNQGVAVPDNTAGQVFEFMLERFRAWYQAEGVSAEVFQSVMELKPVKPLDLALRVTAVNRFAQLPESDALAAANKRVSNILQKYGAAVPESVREDLFSEPAEKALATAVDDMSAIVTPLFGSRDYTIGLEKLAMMRPVVDEFFEQVMVMVEDEAVKENRLALLARLRNLFLQVADISCLHRS